MKNTRSQTTEKSVRGMFSKTVHKTTLEYDGFGSVELERFYKWVDVLYDHLTKIQRLATAAKVMTIDDINQPPHH